MMQVVIPGRVESIAVSKVQSIKAPFGSNSRCAGSICARTAAATPGRSSADNSPESAVRAAGNPIGPAPAAGGALAAMGAL